jgi:hypothetical protein
MPSAGTQEFPAEYVKHYVHREPRKFDSIACIYNDNMLYYSKDRFLSVTHEKSSAKIFIKKYANDAISFEKKNTKKEMADVCVFFLAASLLNSSNRSNLSLKWLGV